MSSCDCGEYATCTACLGRETVPFSASKLETKEKETVDHPSHYNVNGLEVIDIIEAFDLGFNLGNAVKYILRSGRKDPSKTNEDLRKALWYIDRSIKMGKP